MSSLLSLLRAGDELLSRVVRAICVVAMASIFIMFILNVFVRFVPIYNFTQTDDWIQFALVWMIFLGAQELVRTRNHFVVDLFTDRLRDRLSGRILRVIVCAIELATYAVICYYGWIWVMRSNATMQSIPWMDSTACGTSSRPCAVCATDPCARRFASRLRAAFSRPVFSRHVRGRPGAPKISRFRPGESRGNASQREFRWSSQKSYTRPVSRTDIPVPHADGHSNLFVVKGLRRKETILFHSGKCFRNHFSIFCVVNVRKIPMESLLRNEFTILRNEFTKCKLHIEVLEQKQMP